MKTVYPKMSSSVTVEKLNSCGLIPQPPIKFVRKPLGLDSHLPCDCWQLLEWAAEGGHAGETHTHTHTQTTKERKGSLFSQKHRPKIVFTHGTDIVRDIAICRNESIHETIPLVRWHCTHVYPYFLQTIVTNQLLFS